MTKDDEDEAGQELPMRQNLQKQKTEWTWWGGRGRGALTSQTVNSSVLGSRSPYVFRRLSQQWEPQFAGLLRAGAIAHTIATSWALMIPAPDAVLMWGWGW